MTDRILDVYLNDVPVGKLNQNQAGSLSFSYDEAFIANSKMGISLSLPLQAESFAGDVVKAFFSGLLPEESVRQRLAKYLGVSEKNPFALLKAIGGECAGALSLYPEGQTPPVAAKGDTEILDDNQLREILDLIKRRPMLAGDNKMRLSLAGAQDKLAIGFQDGKVALIKDGAPTTHILKPLIEHVTDSVHNELFCMRLAKRIGITTPHADIHFVGETPCYIVERYDRTKMADGVIRRIHQEDFCQALGILPEIKYEREGGPSLAKCQEILTAHSVRPAADQMRFIELVIFNYLIGNADAHGKNFSLLYKGPKPELAPAYDLLSTAIYPDLSEKMAMKIGRKYKPDDVFLRHWHRLVPDTKAATANLEKQLLTLSARTLEHALALKEELQKTGLKSWAFDAICALIQIRAKKLQEQIKR